MAGKGETVKYVIDADTSGFSRGMSGAALEAEIAGKKIDRALSGTSKKSENNFKDIRRNAQTAASQIRNFAIAFQAFNVTSAIVGVTALSGALLELSGAIAAAGSTGSVLAPVLAQATAGSLAFKAGVSGLSDAFGAIAKNDGKAFQQSLQNLGPAATSVAYAVGGLNKALNSIKLNTQQALLAGVSDTLLQLGANVLPTVNAGFQIIGRSLNNAFKQAASLAGSPAFSGLLATIFSDTARTIDTLSGALAPLLTIFTNLYGVTAPYVQLLSEFIVNLTKSGAAYLSSATGLAAFNLSIAQGVVALQQIGSLVSSVFSFLISIFRTSVASGVSLISTIVGIVDQMTAWVNSAKGQAQLASLFQFTALVVTTVADAVGQALSSFLGIVQVIANLNPAIQQMIVGFLVSSLVIRPVVTYFSGLYLAIRVLVVTIFNFIQQAFVVASALGGVASIVLILAGGLIILGSVIKGPLGSAFIIVGAAIAAYIGLSYLLTFASNAAASAILRQGYASIATAGAEETLAFATNMAAITMLDMAGAATAAGGGLTFAARGVAFLQAALVPLLVLAAGIAVILGMLGVFSGKAKDAQSASTGLGGSLGALQKSHKGVGASGNKTSAGGLADLSDSLATVGNAADTAQGNLAAFDKMNVLTDSSAASAGIPGLPSLPSAGSLGGLGGGIASPTIDTGDFDKAISDMTGQFDGLKKDLDAGFPNPFDEIGKFINANPVPFLIAFTAVVVAIGLAFLFFNAATLPLTGVLTLIVIAIVAIVAIIILLYKNWGTIWPALQKIVGDVLTNIGNFFNTVFTAIGKFVSDTLTNISNFFVTIFSAILFVVKAYIDIYIAVFKFAWDAIVAIWNVAVPFFTAIWNGISAAFSAVVSFFSSIFSGAWEGIKNAFNAVGGFFRGVWNTIVSIFGTIGTTIGDALGGAFKSVVNTVLNTVSGIINTVVDLINGAIGLINKIPGVKIGTMPHLTLPRLAKGGIVTSPTVAQIGESGAEAVMPLENNTQWIDKLASKINTSPSQSANPDIIPVTNKKDQSASQTTINVSGVFATSEQEKRKIAEMIAKQLESIQRAKGLRGTF